MYRAQISEDQSGAMVDAELFRQGYDTWFSSDGLSMMIHVDKSRPNSSQ